MAYELREFGSVLYYDGREETILANYRDIQPNCIEKVIIASEVTQLDSSGLYLFNHLKSVEFEEPCCIERICSNAFLNCWELSEFSVPDSCETIEEFAFQLSGIKVLHFGSGVRNLDPTSLASTKVETISVDPKNPYYTDMNANGVYRLTKEGYELLLGTAETVIIDGTVSIGPSAFAERTLKHCLVFPESLKVIREDAFFDTEGLRRVELESVEEISDRAFRNCRDLKEVKWSEKLRYIGDGSFANTGITSLYLGRDFRYLCGSAFQGCENFRSINVSAQNELYTASEDHTALISKSRVTYDLPVYVKEKHETYICHAVIDTDTFVLGVNHCHVPEGVRIIAEESLLDRVLDDRQLPKSVEDVRDPGAMDGEEKLLWIPENIRHIRKLVSSAEFVYLLGDHTRIVHAELEESVKLLAPRLDIESLPSEALINAVRGYVHSLWTRDNDPNCGSFPPKYEPEIEKQYQEYIRDHYREMMVKLKARQTEENYLFSLLLSRYRALFFPEQIN